MKRLWISLLIILVAVSCLKNEISFPSHFDFTAVNSLGREEEINRTFQNLQAKITQIGNVTYPSTPTTFYTIFNAKPTFFYDDSNQYVNSKAERFIVVPGGMLQANLSFDWCKTQLNDYSFCGTGAVIGKSKTGFSYQILQEENYYNFKFLDYLSIKWDQPFQITQLHPAFATAEDRTIITQMLNHIPESSITTIGSLLEEEISQYIGQQLKNNFQHQNRPHYFDYIWSPGYRTNVSIPMVRNLMSMKLDENQLKVWFNVMAKDDKNWRPIKRSVPQIPLDPFMYGDNQGFVSLDFYENMIRYVAVNKILNTHLNRENWGTSTFHFVAGDLFQVIPQLKARYSPSEAISGSCLALDNDKIQVVYVGGEILKVFIQFSCDLQTKSEKFAQFLINLELLVRGEVRQKVMNFELENFELSVAFHNYHNFKIVDKELAKSIIKDCLNRMREGSLFGSGFPTGSFKNQHYVFPQSRFTVSLQKWSHTIKPQKHRKEKDPLQISQLTTNEE